MAEWKSYSRRPHSSLLLCACPCLACLPPFPPHQPLCSSSRREGNCCLARCRRQQEKKKAHSLTLPHLILIVFLPPSPFSVGPAPVTPLQRRATGPTPVAAAILILLHCHWSIVNTAAADAVEASGSSGPASRVPCGGKKGRGNPIVSCSSTACQRGARSSSPSLPLRLASERACHKSSSRPGKSILSQWQNKKKKKKREDARAHVT
jgi:hypothetical protein